MSETLRYMTKYLINEICIPGICAVCIEDYFNHFNTILKYTVLGIRVTQLNDTRTIAVKFFATCTKNTNHRHAIHVLYTCISIVFGFKPMTSMIPVQCSANWATQCTCMSPCWKQVKSEFNFIPIIWREWDTCNVYMIWNTILSRLNAGGVYLKLGLVDPAFIRTRRLFGARRLFIKWIFHHFVSHFFLSSALKAEIPLDRYMPVFTNKKSDCTGKN